MSRSITTSSDLERLWDFSHPAETEAVFTEAALAMRDAQTSDQSLIIETITQIGRAQCLQGKLEEAQQTLEKAHKLLDENVSSYNVRARIRYLLEVGRMYCLMKTPARARPVFSEAWMLSSGADEDFLAADAAQMVASVEPPKMQKEWTLKALGLAESTSDERAKRYLCSLYSTLGWSAFELHQFVRAKELFTKALATLDADLVGGGESAAVIRKIRITKWAIGKTLRALGQVEDALKIQEELFAEMQSSGSKSGDICEELAECLILLKRASEAVVYFEIAYRELSKDEWVVDNMPDRMRRLKSLGKVK